MRSAGSCAMIVSLLSAVGPDSPRVRMFSRRIYAFYVAVAVWNINVPVILLLLSL
jgi:hypothetical protein